LLDSQRVTAKFWHHTHPRRVYVVLEFAFSLSLATMAECCQNTDFGRVRFGFAVTLLINNNFRSRSRVGRLAWGKVVKFAGVKPE
jgi:hypothetical protein